MATAKKYEVLVSNLVGLAHGDIVTEAKIEKAGGTVAHLLKLGAISVEPTTNNKEKGAS